MFIILESLRYVEIYEKHEDLFYKKCLSIYHKYSHKLKRQISLGLKLRSCEIMNQNDFEWFLLHFIMIVFETHKNLWSQRKAMQSCKRVLWRCGGRSHIHSLDPSLSNCHVEWGQYWRLHQVLNNFRLYFTFLNGKLTVNVVVWEYKQFSWFLPLILLI